MSVVQHGQEVDTIVLDNNFSTIETVDTLKDATVTTRFKRYNIRIKVQNKQDEMTQYLHFSDVIDRKLQAGELFIRDIDPSTQPNFGLEYRKNMEHGYFVIFHYCEVVL